MENFITGYPGHEDGMRRSLKSVMGQEKYDHYFNSFLHHFFTEKDADFFKEVSSSTFTLQSSVSSRCRP